MSLTAPAATRIFECVSAARSDVGRIRRENEDACLERPEIGVWAVADGMGGHAAGAHASRTIVEHLALVPLQPTLSALVEAVEAALVNANEALIEFGMLERQTVGSTVVALALHGDHASAKPAVRTVALHPG